MNTKNEKTYKTSRRGTSMLYAISASALLVLPSALHSQSAGDAGEEEVFTLSPFTVEGSDDNGYRATSTLAGTRIRTDLRDVGSAISVLTEEFMDDIGGTDNETVLAYALNTEVGGSRGNFSGGVSSGSTIREQSLFANPNSNTRVRGLSGADNTRNFFRTDVPWDGYAVSRVDLQRGPNAILFGLGSPAGVVNASLDQATFSNEGEAGIGFDQFGSLRLNVKYNVELIEDELAVRIALLDNEQKFRQKPAFEDDVRQYLAVTYKPKSLNSEGSRFEFSGNFENGKIKSNRPRVTTPEDLVSAYWTPVSQGGLGQQTFNGFGQQDLIDNNLETALGTIGTKFESNPKLLINSNKAWAWDEDQIFPYGGINADGNLIGHPVPDGDGALYSGRIFGDEIYAGLVPQSFSSWAIGAGLPYADNGFYENNTLSDRSIFDFYNNLIDGPNKGEWTDWQTFEVGFTNTYLNDKVGINVTYFDQDLDRGQWGVLGWNNRIYMDINDILPDGSGNPDVGRAYVQEQLGSTGTSTASIGREALRAQVFGEYDFRDSQDGLWGKIFGRHSLTGLYSEDKTRSDNRELQNYGFDPAYLAAHGVTSLDDDARAGFRYYLSDDLRGASSASGTNINRMTQSFLTSGGASSVRAFNSTWTANSVDPATEWTDPLGVVRTESANPANYAGWGSENVNIISFFGDETVNGMSSRDYLTSRAILSDSDIESKVAVWQGFFWDDAIVGTYGYRKDQSKSAILSADERSDRGADLSSSAYTVNNPNASIDSLDTTTSNWSVAVHVNELWGEKDTLPFNVSLYYNEGESFQPSAGRLDFFAQPLEAPHGVTEEVSMLLATKDNKYSLRVTSYETTVTNQESTGDIGGMWALEQAIFVPGISFGEFNPGGSWDVNEHPDPDRLQNVIMPAWHQFEVDLATMFPDFVGAWVDGPWPSESPWETSAQRPAGSVYTEDAFSEGLEFEFIANPTENWSVLLNASKTEAIRDRVPGESFLSLATFVDDQMQNTPVGEMPVWWASSPGVKENIYNSDYRGDYLKLLALNGQSQGEIRKWRANLVTTYRFSDGKFKNFRVGGGYRYGQANIIDYPPLVRADGSVSADIDNPYKGPSDKTVDLWFGYSKQLSDRIGWDLQVNLYNAFGENELVALNTQPDGTPSAYRIKEGSSWSISNTFSF